VTADGLTRREALAAGLAGAAALYGLDGGTRLLEAAAEAPRAGRLQDIEHVVILIQENRSFDHYFGTYRGVRGFSDPHALPGVFAQPGYPAPGYDGRLLPFHLDTAQGHGVCVPDPTHAWGAQHRSFAGGRMDGFVTEHLAADGADVGAITMGHYRRGDLPFYHALADAFTICDGYHCSVLGPSYPNQVYAVSATLDPAGRAGGPLVEGASPGSLSWTTMPEQLQARGISWKVYTSPDNYTPGEVGDPPFQFFAQYSRRPDLAANALTPTFPGDFQADARAGSLPRVSWVYAPVAWSEHPPAPARYGEATTALVLSTLTDDPALWAKTALFVTWDENGGFFDHVVPPVPPPGTPGEFLQTNPLPDAAEGIAGPIGLGFRVPLLICSPFSRGGFVCSDTFDHTSVLRFLEARFGAEVPNLSAWRRATCGDLTSALNFAGPDRSVPALPPTSFGDPSVAGGDCTTNVPGKLASSGTVVVPPNSMPRQEPGSPRRPSGLPGSGSATGPGRRKRRRRKKRRRRHHRRHHARRHRKRRRRTGRRRR
jgi:phospholipase C